jgi:hypothetical protein
MLFGLQASAGNVAVQSLVNGSVTVQRFWPFDDEEETVEASEGGSVSNEGWDGGEASPEDAGPEDAGSESSGESGGADDWIGPGGDWGSDTSESPGGGEASPADGSQSDGSGGQDWIGPGGDWGAEEDADAEGAEEDAGESDLLGGKEPCFDSDAQAEIGLGVAWADAAAAHLTAKPPSLDAAVAELAGALETWEGTSGSDPGQSSLNEAKDVVRRPAVRVSAYSEPVSAMLEQLSVAAVTASGDASAAKTMMTEPASADEEPRPCFEEGQQAVIAEAVNLADGAATELTRRPPDYRKALAALRTAAANLGSLGGEAPGQAALQGAVSTLDRVVDGVGAYLAPVDSVVTEAASDVEAASAQAREAAGMAVPDESTAA